MTLKKIVYPIAPSRLNNETWDKILDFIRKQGCTPFDHRRGAPFDDFELKLGREKTLLFLKNIMTQCDAAWVFGISEGGMGEFKSALDMRDAGSPIEILCFYDFDPEWEKYYEKLKPKFGDLISRLRGSNRLIALVGSRAVGKTFWADQLIATYGEKLARVKNTTTRSPRNERDHLTYNFVSEEEFARGVESGNFLEHDLYNGAHYGSSMSSIREVLANHHGIFAVTPNGAKELYRRRFELNLTIIFLKTESEEILLHHLIKRGIVDPNEQAKFLLESEQFSLPENIPHQIIAISDDPIIDHKRLLSIIDVLP
ncbi:MAG: hypothetical protein HY226_00700 [Candidatus Vogelbacteria bacterium]|nr:hypothetical protein [Candidatus Vogelbacteria bacterium]